MAEPEKMRIQRKNAAGVDHREVQDDAEIDLMELLFRLMEKWKLLAVSALICAVLFGAYSIFFMTPKYQATAKLYVMNPSDSAINLSDLQIGSYLTKDYQEVFQAWEVHQMVIENLNLDYTYTQMQNMLSVSNPSDTRVLYITVTLSDPKLATDIANEYATVAQKYISRTMTTDEPNILSVALQPTRPVGPSKTRNILLGFLLGAVAAAVVVVVQFLMDDKIKTAEDILRYVDLPTLAVVPLQEGGNKRENTGRTRQRRA